MAKELKIELTKKTPDGVHIFKVSGALGVEGSAGIQGLLDACLNEKVYNIILDLEGVTFISSAGMGAFLSAVGELRKKKGGMLLPPSFHSTAYSRDYLLLRSYLTLTKAVGF